jgi:hypothetical protein
MNIRSQTRCDVTYNDLGFGLITEFIWFTSTQNKLQSLEITSSAALNLHCHLKLNSSGTEELSLFGRQTYSLRD